MPPETGHLAVDFRLRRLRKMRCRCLGLDHPLLDQFLEQFVVAFSMPIDQLLESA
jgi:hypothetical protein